MTWLWSPLDWYRKASEGSALCGWVGLLTLGMLALALVGMLVDQRQILGINAWSKPAKFLISSVLYLWTFGWLLTLVEVPQPSKEWAGGVAAAMIFFENVAISGQALRGVRSHYNTTTAFNGMVFSVMGLMIVINTLVICLVLWWFFTNARPLPAAALWGCRLGLFLAVLASLEGGYMAQYGSHAVGVRDGGPGLPFLNWSKEAGDLRISHFIGLHGMQVLPWAGFLLSELGAGAGIWVVALFHYGAFLLTFLQAVARKPLLF
ncbi:MAG: hypothetical protein NW208_10950 [Bryobacter sp.]|nr:hypothetical protein [Bryobacter sp.]